MNTPQSSEPPPTGKPAAGASDTLKLLVAIVALGIAGYSIWRQVRPASSYKFEPAQFAFVDNAQSNVPLGGSDVGSLEFIDAAGTPLGLAQFRGQKNVVLVVTRGKTAASIPGAYSGNICLYCATQTSRLIANYKSFEDNHAEVVVVFPIKQAADAPELDQFNEVVKRQPSNASPPPFPVVLDVELRAVDRLGIRQDLARPATYILDRQGEVRFAYVGATIADRPSVQSMLDQLAAINADAK